MSVELGPHDLAAAVERLDAPSVGDFFDDAESSTADGGRRGRAGRKTIIRVFDLDCHGDIGLRIPCTELAAVVGVSHDIGHQFACRQLDIVTDRVLRIVQQALDGTPSCARCCEIVTEVQGDVGLTIASASTVVRGHVAANSPCEWIESGRRRTARRRSEPCSLGMSNSRNRGATRSLSSVV